MFESSIHSPGNTYTGISGNSLSSLTTTDWNAEWMALRSESSHADDQAWWNKRAETFDTQDSPSDYVDRFLELADIQPGESVLDMGCGDGALALPLAESGHPVIAADFSSRMLEKLQARLHPEEELPLKTVQMSWGDNWADFGLVPKSVDVAIASRSLATRNMAAAIDKLSSTARLRCHATLSAGSSPRIDARVLQELGIPVPTSSDHLYAFMILAQKGFQPTMSYLRNERSKTYETEQAALDDFTAMIARVYDPVDQRGEYEQVRKKLEAWLPGHLEYDQGFRLDQPRQITWAFLTWPTA